MKKYLAAVLLTGFLLAGCVSTKNGDWWFLVVDDSNILRVQESSLSDVYRSSLLVSMSAGNHRIELFREVDGEGFDSTCLYASREIEAGLQVASGHIVVNIPDLDIWGHFMGETSYDNGTIRIRIGPCS